MSLTEPQAPSRATPVDMAALEAKVAGSSFYAAMKRMPPPERAGMFAIYAFCRAVDDIADDGQGARADRAVQLNAWRADIEALYAGGDPGQAAFLATAVRDFQLEKADFLAIIDGMAMDVAQDIVAPSDDELDLYCDRVASAVGRLSVKVFGMDEAPGLALARHLGQALQLTNILRDIDEDAEIGRFYISRQALDAAGMAVSDPLTLAADPRLDKACRYIAARAKAHYAEADKVMAARPKGQLLAPRLMEAVYSRILERMLAKGWTPPRQRVSLSTLEKLWVVLRCSLRS
jgi:squalene synthase HpnD